MSDVVRGAGPPQAANCAPAGGSAAAQAASVGGQVNRGRRQVLAWGAAMAGVALAPGVTLFELAKARAPAEAASNKVRWGMLVDVNRCAPDCDACVTACDKENGLPTTKSATSPQWIRKVELKDMRGGATKSAPVMCQHCAEPPCVDVCPTGASFKRADGIVLVDRHTCIGCRYCMMACPYKARSFVHEPLHDQKADVPRGKGCVESCTMCVHRIDKGLTPACVQACPEGVFVFGDLNDPGSAIARRVREIASSQIRPDLALDTAVRYHGI